MPRIETGQTEARFVTLENSGRDELVVSNRTGFDTVERSQSQWRIVSGLLGDKAVDTFVARDAANLPTLTYQTKDRAMVETVGARIGIAQTLLMVDKVGAYRGIQEYRVENRTEQFLEIEVPASGSIWTVSVANQPIKPIAVTSTSSNAGATATSSTNEQTTTTTTTSSSSRGSASTTPAVQRIRIPLVKNAAGDLDYPVIIKYGGVLARPGALRSTTFPIIRTININVELSQVRLRLAPELHWMNFSGSMGLAKSDDELKAGWLAYRTRQLTELTELLRGSKQVDFFSVRAGKNLRSLGREIEELQRFGSASQNDDFQKQLAYNNQAWSEARQQLDSLEVDRAGITNETTNRTLLNKRLAEQSNGRSMNVANDARENFAREVPSPLAKGKPAEDAAKADSMTAGLIRTR